MDNLIMFIENNFGDGTFELLFVSSAVVAFSFILAVVINIMNKGE